MAEPPQAFRVVYPGKVRDQLLKWKRGTKDPALRSSLLATLSAIQKHLATDPLTWGERAFDLHHARLAVCDGFHERIHVRYAVDETRRIVYIGEYRLLPGHPLAPPS